MYKCGGDPVYANKFIELMESSDIEIGKTDMRRLERIAAEDGSIETDEFLKYGQRSEAVKEYIEKFMRSGPPIDKAELAFKVSVCSRKLLFFIFFLVDNLIIMFAAF